MPSGGSSSTAPDVLRLVGSLTLLLRTLEQELRSCSGADPLSLTELGALGRIERGVDQPSLLARALRLDPARVTHLTDRLVGQGYVARTVDQEDRRRWRLRLTAAGSLRLQAGRTHLRTAMEALLDGLSTEERADLQHGLDGVRRVLDAT